MAHSANELLYGGYGNDELYGGPGADEASGGYGDDTISTWNSPPGTTVQDEVYRGDGVDRVIANPQDRVDPDCENVTWK